MCVCVYAYTNTYTHTNTHTHARTRMGAQPTTVCIIIIYPLHIKPCLTALTVLQVCSGILNNNFDLVHEQNF